MLTLRDGTPVQVRGMTPEDGPALSELFATATAVDVRFLRDDIADPAVVQGWCKALDYSRVLPLLALAGDRAVGQASLHFGCGPERHCGKVRVFVAPDFRRCGLGTRLVDALVDVAHQRGLEFVIAEVVSEQAWLIRAGLRRGFKLCFSLADSFMLRDGSTRDVTILRKQLRPPGAEPGTATREG